MGDVQRIFVIIPDIIQRFFGSPANRKKLQAGLLRVKLAHLDELTQKRYEVAQRYLAEMKNSKVQLPDLAEGCTHVYHLFVVQVEDRDRFMKHLADNGVGSDIHYPIPPFLAKPYQHLGYTYADFPMTEKLYAKIVSLPIYDGMTEEEVNAVIAAVNSYE